MLELIGYDRRYDRVAAYLLGDVIVVENLRLALDLWRRTRTDKTFGHTRWRSDRSTRRGNRRFTRVGPGRRAIPENGRCASWKRWWPVWRWTIKPLWPATLATSRFWLRFSKTVEELTAADSSQRDGVVGPRQGRRPVAA